MSELTKEQQEIMNYLKNKDKEFLLRYIENTIRFENVLDNAPTAEEVCEALSEYLNEPVWFDDKGNIRITTQWVTQQIYLKGKYIGINIQVVLPPRLITLIGKFYENEVEKE
jgi:hypothetical protein